MARIWLINQYASTPETGQGGRHHHFARLLAERGHDVCVIAARHHHLLARPELSRRAPQIEDIEGYRFVRLDTPGYDGPHDKRRILGWFSFAWQLRALDRIIGASPDSVCVSSLSLVSYLGAERLARRLHARLVFEVRDLWPLTAVELGNFRASHPFVRFLQWVEDRGYRNADHVISTLSNAYVHMQAHGLPEDRYTWIPNGVMAEDGPVEELDAAVRAVIPETGFVVGYTGSFGLANSLETVLDAAERLKTHPEIKFVLVGAGPKRNALMADSHARKLDNVIFAGSVPKDQVQSAIRHFSACIICWDDNPLYRFGTSANKLAEYMLSGKPIVQAYSGANDLVAKQGLGYTVPARNGQALAEAIVRLSRDSYETRKKMGRRGRNLAAYDYSYPVLCRRFEEIVAGGNA